MTFLSYSQNFEDVLLWRALGHVKNGFYIDVGANDPELHSVTKAFYDAGWWGINIEPMPSYHHVFAEQRPRDINLTVAAGDAEGTITLFEVPSMNGWASTDRAVADAHRADGYEVTETDVPLRLLKDICAEHVRGDIHFLKIDVEGFEEAVLRGMDFARWRPWILVIEATLPNSRATNHDTWEALVTGHDYRFAYFDGLNRYYVAAEHAELLPALSVQANVFDGFISHHLDKAWQRAELADVREREVGRRLEATDAQLQASQAHLQASHANLRDSNANLQAIQAHLADTNANLQASQANLRDSNANLQAIDLRLQETLALSEHLLSQLNEAQARAHASEIGGLQFQARIAELEAHLKAVNEEGHRLSVWASGLEQQLLAMYESTSWRVTRPLRLLKRVRRSGLRAKFKRHASRVLRAVLRRLGTSETARRLILPLLRHFPSFQLRLSRVARDIRNSAAPAQPSDVAEVPAYLSALPLSARAVLADLQRLRPTEK
jgi:FkbM family methyltransferase